MNRGLIISAALHFIICILMIFGLPVLFEPKIEPEPLVIAVNVMNIRDISNLPPMPSKPKKPVEPKKVEPPKPDKPKPDKKDVTKNEQPKIAPPEPKKEEVKPPKPVEKKEKPKKEEKPKEEKKEEKEPTLEDILKSVSKDVEKTQTKETPKESMESESISQKDFDPAMEISATVRDAIRGQISGCWKFFGGGKDDGTISVTIQIHYNQDGTVAGVKVPITQQAIINTNPSVRNLYNTARNAVLAPECDPLKGLPPSEYNSWKKIEMTFAPTGII